MIVSSEEARLIFSRWKDESAPVRVRLSNDALAFDGVGVVGVTQDTLEFSGPAWRFVVPLAGAEYSFSDPREIPIVSIRTAESAQYEFGIAVTLASGDRLTLLEMKG
jgi:hypothetical protein